MENIVEQLWKDNPITKIVVIYYHGLSKKDQSKFANQMNKLLDVGIPISLNDSTVLNKRKPYIAVTFDDGLISFGDYALPELEKRKIPVTIFIPTGWIGKHPGWMSKEKYEYIKDRVMTISEIKDVAKNPLVTIGSHCVSHSRLCSLSDVESFREMKDSKSTLETIIGQPVNLISFPHGIFNNNHLEYAFSVGYNMAFSIHPEIVGNLEKKNVIGRFAVDTKDWMPEYNLKLHGFYAWPKWLNKIRNM